MKKVLLVQPPYVQVPGRFNQSPPVPPLGIAYLASYIRENAPNDVEVRIIDAFSERLGEKEIIERAKSFPPDVLGFTTVTLTANFVKRIAPEIRRALPDTLLLAGGPHPSALPDDLLPSVDLTVRGEGEQTLLALLNNPNGEKHYRDIPGISFFEDGKLVNNPPMPYIQDIDSIPFPARDLLPMHLYEHHYPYKTRNRSFTTFFTSRGCPFSCSFCCKHVIWGNKARFRSLDNVFSEIESLTEEFDTSFYFFYDDTFTVNRKRILEFANRKERGGHDFKWSCLTRADCLDDELLSIMKSAGCVEMQIGIESGNDDILKSINKKTDLGVLGNAFKLLKKHGMRTKGFFILGHLNDTAQTMKNTVDMALKLDPSWIFFSTLIPLPGSELYEIAKEKGYLETNDWDMFNYHNRPIIHTNNFTSGQLHKIRQDAYKRFYLRPRKLLSYAFDVIRSGGYKRMWNNFLAFMDLSSASS